jgi:hypothetical protein
MASRTSEDGSVEAEAVIVETASSGALWFTLDDGEQLAFDPVAASEIRDLLFPGPRAMAA